MSIHDSPETKPHKHVVESTRIVEHELQQRKESLKENIKPNNFITEIIEKSEDILGKETVVEILRFISKMELIGAFFCPYYREMMEEQAPEDIKAVFGSNHNITSKQDISRLLSAWEGWQKEEGNNGKSFQDFLYERQQKIEKSTGKITVDALLAKKTIPDTAPPEANTVLESMTKQNAQDFVHKLFNGQDLKALVALSRIGELSSVERAKFETFKDTYPKSLPKNKKQAFLELCESLTGKDKLRVLARDKLAQTLNVKMQDIVALENNKIRIENRGQKGDAEVIIKENGDYSVTISGETRSFLDHQTQELVGFLKGEEQ